MNILLLTLMYPQDQIEEVSRNAKDKLQNQINNYQRAFIEGIRANLSAGERLDILNSLPVGIFPTQYRKLFLKTGDHDGGEIHQIGCINLPWLKQKGRTSAFERAIIEWVKKDSNNRTVLVYTQYLPYMKALSNVKKRFPDLKVAVIVTDLPNEMGLASGRRGILKKLEEHIGRQSVGLLRQMDGYILLTEPMAEALGVRGKPIVIIEGLILSDSQRIAETASIKRPVFLYTGTLESGLGINEMLEAFEQMPEYDLWICGHGNGKDKAEAYAKRCANIHFFGFVPQKKALAMQANATALLNPRQPSGVFTRYSFPSKTLEYMRSGKPVLCCKLEGIPADYDPYLCYMNSGTSGIIQAVHAFMNLDAEERKELGNSARNYVLQHKNPRVQCKRLIALLRGL